MNRSRDEKVMNLPRIQSQTRVHTAHTHYNDRKDTQHQSQANTNRAISRQGNPNTLRKTLSSAKTSKAFKNETTGVIYARKIDDLEKQNILITRQVKALEEQIDTLRQQQMNKKRKDDEFINQDQDKSVISNVTSGGCINFRKNISLNNPIALKNQIKIAENKIDTLRKKIDKQNDKNNITKKEVDALRKQINTTKSLSAQLQIFYNKTNEKYEEQFALSRRLDELIAQKNTLMHKRKVDSLHQKAKMIKQYDTILKTLDKQMETEKLARNAHNDSRGNNFYVTEIGLAHKQSVNSTQLNSPTKRKINYSKEINIAQAELDSYEEQFKILKEHTGTSNADKITQDFMKKYQQNFERYKFIQEVYQNLEQLKLEKEDLETRKKQIITQIQNKNTQSKSKQIFVIKVKLNSVTREKEKCKENIQEYETVFNELKSVVKLFFQKINSENKIPPELVENLNQNNLLLALSIIQERQNELSGFESQNMENINFSNNEGDLQELMELTKKQTDNNKGDKLLTREDFIQARENIIVKKKKSQKGKIATHVHDRK